MERGELWGRVRNPLWSAAALVIVIAGAKAAGPVLVPLFVAVFLAIVCAPVVGLLRRWRLPQVLAVALVVVGLMALLAAAGAIFAESINQFSGSVPRYQERLSAMARELAELGGRLFRSQQLEMSAERLFGAVDPGAVMALVGSSMNALAGLLSDAVLVLLTLVFILLEVPTLPSKLRRFAGPDANIDQFRRIASDVQRYLAVKTILAIVTGSLVGVWNAVLGIDFALLWALTTFLLNYIPNIGVIFAAVPALLLALVQYGAARALVLLAGYVAIGMVVGNFVEPLWLGKRLGLSTLVVFLSLVVWGWIWGWVGMLLSVPLTMVVKIMLESSKDWASIAALLDGAQSKAPPKLPAALARFSVPPPRQSSPSKSPGPPRAPEGDDHRDGGRPSSKPAAGSELDRP